jgi:hypothetical protein
MFNNLVIVSGDYGYGYESYYLTRKNEELNFPSNANIASSFGATNYEVRNVNFSVEMNVKGTLVSFSETENGFSSAIAKHISVFDKVVTNAGSGTAAKYYLGKVVASGNLGTIVRGTVYDGAVAVQTFTVDRDTMVVAFENIGTPAIFCTAGTFGSDDDSGSGDEESYLSFTWNSAPGANSIVVDYEYLSSNITYVLSKTSPENFVDQYDNISIYGLTSIETKYIKIMTNFKCKIPVGYTYVKSRTFYTRCKYKSSSCSSNSSAIVPAITVCNQRLF